MKLKVLYIIWSLGLGGAERVVINLAKGLDKTKFNPLICCLNDKGIFAQELEKEGIKVIELKKTWKFDFAVIKKLTAIIKENRIDIVHTHLWGANFWGRLAAQKAKVPVIIATEHNSDIWKTHLHFMLDRFLARKTDKIIAVSNSVKEFYVSKGITAEKVEVIYNGIEVRGQSPLQDSAIALTEPVPILLGGTGPIGNDELVLAMIGRLVPQKGHRYFLLALKELLTQIKTKSLIVGSGPLESKLKELAKSLRLGNSVIFTGFRQDITNILQETDILVMPSLREGLPMILLEAMATGVPVIAARVGGIPEIIIDAETGLLVEPKDTLGLSRAIKRLIEDKDLRLRLSNNAKKMIDSEFNISNMVNKTESLYEGVFKAKNK